MVKLAKQRLSKSQYGLGTNNVLTIFGSKAENILSESFNLIAHYEDLLTINRPHSQLQDVNQAAGKHSVPVDPAVFHLVKTALAYTKENFGFNVTMGSLVKLWDIGFKDAQVPRKSAIQAKLKLLDPNLVQLDEANFSIFLTKTGMTLDLGGIAKGYIADRIKNLWQAYDVPAGIINLGGNVLLVGNSPLHFDGRWRVGVQDPTKPRGGSVGMVTLKDWSAVTSGIYERFLKKNGHLYHHLLDPRTGYPLQTQLAGVTVFTTNSIIGEMEAKRLFFAGKPIPNWGMGQPELHGAVFIYQDGLVKPVNIELH